MASLVHGCSLAHVPRIDSSMYGASSAMCAKVPRTHTYAALASPSYISSKSMSVMFERYTSATAGYRLRTSLSAISASATTCVEVDCKKSVRRSIIPSTSLTLSAT